MKLSIFEQQAVPRQTTIKSMTKVQMYLCLLLLPLIMVKTAWFYTGSKVDESEMVLFAVGFLGGDLDPVWDGYGHLGMYMIGALYFLVGQVSVVFGGSETLTDFAAEHIFSGYFFILARLLFAFCAVTAIAMCASLMSKLAVHRALIVLFVVSVAMSPKMIYYANYVRSDTLVALFTACAFVSAVHAYRFVDVFKVVIFTAAAVACKISALSLAGLLVAVCAVQLLHKRLSWFQVLGLALIFLSFIQLLSPYMGYFELIELILDKEYSGSEAHLLRFEYISFIDKIIRIAEMHISVVGIPGCFFAILSLLGLRTNKGKAIAYAWLTMLLTICPYLLGATLREYWFLPSYLLVAVLAFFTLDMSFVFLKRYMAKRVRVALLIFTAISALLFPVQKLTASYIELDASHSGGSNQMQAKAWLEKNHVGVSPILLDLHFSYVYPKTYDPNSLENSRGISGLFTYERAENKFLSTVFERYLYSEYLQNVVASNHSFLKVSKIQLELDSEVTFIETPEICSKYSSECVELALVEKRNIKVVEQSKSRYFLEVTGGSPHLVFDVQQVLPIDGTFYVTSNSDAGTWRLLFTFGDDLEPSLATAFTPGGELIPISVPEAKPWIHWFRVHEYASDKVNNSDKAVFITSPWTYRRFKRIIATSAPESRRRKDAEKYVKWYDQIKVSKPIRIFDSAPGAAIYVYDVPDSLTKPKE